MGQRLNAPHWEHRLTDAPAALFGLALYLFNFHVMVLAFPWFAEPRGWAAVCAHLVFGGVAAAVYRRPYRKGVVRS